MGGPHSCLGVQKTLLVGSFIDFPQGSKYLIIIYSPKS